MPLGKRGAYLWQQKLRAEIVEHSLAVYRGERQMDS